MSPSPVEILTDKGDNRLTLMACNPKYSARQRIVVEAVLVETRRRPRPGPQTTARPSCPTTAWPAATHGRAARRSSGRWSPCHLVRGLVPLEAAPARVVARAPYVVLVPFFAVALYASFENITRLLPGAY